MSPSVPVLGADKRRLTALAAASDDARDRLVPLVLVPPPAAAVGATAPRHGPTDAALLAHLGAALDSLAHSFGTRRAYLDAEAVDRRRVADGRSAAAWLFDEARALGLALVPVTGLRRSDAFHLAVAEAASVDRRGLGLHLELADFADLDGLPAAALAAADAVGLSPERVDLLVDLGPVSAAESPVLAVATRAVVAPLERAAAWRRVALTAPWGLGRRSPPRRRTPPGGWPAVGATGGDEPSRRAPWDAERPGLLGAPPGHPPPGPDPYAVTAHSPTVAAGPGAAVPPPDDSGPPGGAGGGAVPPTRRR